MNKQELIMQLESFQESENPNTWKSGYNAGISESIGLVEQLDEPQKVKVPAIMAEYINYCIANERTLAEALSGLDRDFKIPDYLYPAIKWLEDSINQNIFAQAWLFGYEVEEEPKWVVKRKDNGKYVESLALGKGIGFIAETTALVQEDAYKFSDKVKADAVANLIDGTVEKV
ncbi:DUF1642 domain-containing protein [Enterococcus sp. AZ072]|uniref:DUF1642 domain-containing protein n=1 Tax=unclassified Enterococcus TaxID=2608891 RepID=UPI003D2A22B1